MQPEEKKKLDKFIGEIKLSREKLQLVKDLFSGRFLGSNITPKANLAVLNWKNSVKYCGYFTEKFVKELCEKPGLFEENFLNPLYNWLVKYEENLIKSDPNFNLDVFLTRGIEVIYRFVEIAFYFAERPQYYSQVDHRKKAQEFMFDLVAALSGCTEALQMMFNRMKKIPLNREMELKKLNIQDMCNKIRVAKLRMP